MSSGTSTTDRRVQPDLRCLDDREEVDVFAVPADRVVQHVPVLPHPELDGVRVGQRRQVLDRHDAAEGAGPGVDGVVGSGDETPDRGAHPVRADDQVCALDAAVGELQHDRVALVDDVDEPAAEVQVFGAERAAERLLDVRAVDPEVRPSEPLLVPVVLADGMGRDPAPVLPVPVDELGGDRGVGGQPAVETEPCELPDGVGRQRDGGADLGQLGGLFEHISLDASLLQCETEGQTPHSGTDDRHTRTGFSHAVDARAHGGGFAPVSLPGSWRRSRGVPEVYDPRHPVASARRA